MNQPVWLTGNKVKISLDARSLLAQGLHPFEQVQQECAAMKQDEIFEIITPFSPVPMIDKMSAAGFETHSESGEDGMVHTFFKK